MKYSIGITTYFRRFEEWFKPLIIEIKRQRPDVEIIISINGEMNSFYEDYRHSILDFLKDYDNCFPIFYPRFRSISRMWNLNVQFATNENILLFEDDIILKEGFFDEYEGVLNIFTSHEFKTFLINQSFSAFSVNKNELISSNWFDERFLGLGHEDGDYMNRYLKWSDYKHNLLDCSIKIESCVNLDDERILKLVEDEVRLEGQRLCNQFNRYSEFNREFKDSELIKNSSIQYPYEKFYLENKHKL